MEEGVVPDLAIVLPRKINSAIQSCWLVRKLLEFIHERNKQEQAKKINKQHQHKGSEELLPAKYFYSYGVGVGIGSLNDL